MNMCIQIEKKKYKNILIYSPGLSQKMLKKSFVLFVFDFLLFDRSDVDIIFFLALISVSLLIYFCSMVASSNRLTNNAVQFALDRQRIEHFSYYFV